MRHLCSVSSFLLSYRRHGGFVVVSRDSTAASVEPPRMGFHMVLCQRRMCCGQWWAREGLADPTRKFENGLRRGTVSDIKSFGRSVYAHARGGPPQQPSLCRLENETWGRWECSTLPLALSRLCRTAL